MRIVAGPSPPTSRANACITAALSRCLADHSGSALLRAMTTPRAGSMRCPSADSPPSTPPYNLSIKDRQGDPLHGGVLHFDILGASMAGGEGWVGEVSWADMREVLVTLRPIAGPRPACEVTVRSPVAWAFRLNSAFGGTITAAGGAAGFGLGSAAAGTVAAVGAGLGLGAVATALAVLVVIGGGLTGGALTMMGYRRLYDLAIRKGERALEAMLTALAVRAQGGWGIAPRTPGGEVEALPEAEG